MISKFLIAPLCLGLSFGLCIGLSLTAPAQDAALRDMSYLLNDNVEVITAPPAPAV